MLPGLHHVPSNPADRARFAIADTRLGSSSVPGPHRTENGDSDASADFGEPEKRSFIIRLFIDISGWLRETFGDPGKRGREGGPKFPTGGIRGEITPRVVPTTETVVAGIHIRANVSGTSKSVQDAARQAIAWSAALLHAEMLSRVTERRGPAPPGTPPGIDTGRLANSLAVEFETDGFGVTVGATVPYAWYLEFGTLTMPARPFVHPTFEHLEPKIREKFRQQVFVALRTEGRVQSDADTATPRSVEG